MLTLPEIVNIIESEGFQGAHTLIFLIKYAYLADDKKLMSLVENTLESMDSLPESEMLYNAYKELYAATGKGLDALKFLKSRGYGAAKEDMPWDLLDRYRETYDPSYLERAIKGAEYILKNFHDMFNPENVYDISEPSFNSRVAVLYDEIARYTQDKKWKDARDKQNKFIRLLSDKYPTGVGYGLIALLGEEFGETTVVCEGEIPSSVLNFYAPTTAIVFKPSEKKSIGIMKDGVVEQIKL